MVEHVSTSFECWRASAEGSQDTSIIKEPLVDFPGFREHSGPMI